MNSGAHRFTFGNVTKGMHCIVRVTCGERGEKNSNCEFYQSILREKKKTVVASFM